MHEVQKDIADGFRLSFDHFGRSSSQRNHRLTQHFAGKLAENGLIEEVSEKQVYSIADNRFLPDRYIDGTCPNCGYDTARGDQCENCTKQLDPTDLINPRSAISGSTDLEVRETKHLYLRQRALRDKLEAWIDSKTDWPILTTSIAKKWLNDGDGLQDRGITRDLHWGVPVKKGDQPWPGMEGKVFYVWFDAPIEYIAATAEWADAQRQARCRLGTLVAHRQGRRRRTYPVHGQGQRALPHPVASPPRSWARASRGSWSTTSSRSTT